MSDHKANCDCPDCGVEITPKGMATAAMNALNNAIVGLLHQIQEAEAERDEVKKTAARSEAYAAEMEFKNIKLNEQVTALSDANHAYRCQVAGLSAELDHVRERLNRSLALLQTPKEVS